ncbi:MAG: hypothetical protein V2J89_04310 [Halieaceae bacterium]|jgi:hypothetical protein|nr:hypothetical protein [Halieaceae bacterium]
MLLFRSFLQTFVMVSAGKLGFTMCMCTCIPTLRAARATFLMLLLAAVSGCASSPIPASFANHFDSARDNPQHGRCMSDHAMFNNRQLMIMPEAVEDAWTYCVKQSDLWYPGKPQRNPVSGWEQR